MGIDAAWQAVWVPARQQAPKTAAAGCGHSSVTTVGAGRGTGASTPSLFHDPGVGLSKAPVQKCAQAGIRRDPRGSFRTARRARTSEIVAQPRASQRARLLADRAVRNR